MFTSKRVVKVQDEPGQEMLDEAHQPSAVRDHPEAGILCRMPVGIPPATRRGLGSRLSAALYSDFEECVAFQISDFVAKSESVWARALFWGREREGSQPTLQQPIKCANVCQ